mmetsp:Transcript_24140/g.83808  ORF Transcript_24140/g.83808 Transcript_24140/m.83808 type:complete len:212 (-) Transcript_24140:1708-2343(-)
MSSVGEPLMSDGGEPSEPSPEPSSSSRSDARMPSRGTAAVSAGRKQIVKSGSVHNSRMNVAPKHISGTLTSSPLSKTKTPHVKPIAQWLSGGSATKGPRNIGANAIQVTMVPSATATRRGSSDARHKWRCRPHVAYSLARPPHVVARRPNAATSALSECPAASTARMRFTQPCHALRRSGCFLAPYTPNRQYPTPMPTPPSSAHDREMMAA